jgi:3-dehydroquinate synthetase
LKQTLRVNLGSRSYDIIIAPELLQNSKPFLDPIIAGRRVAVISDKIVSNKYLNLLSPTLDSITDSWDLFRIEGGDNKFKYLFETILSLITATLLPAMIGSKNGFEFCKSSGAIIIS